MMALDLNKCQERLKKVSMHGIKEVAIVQYGDAQDEFTGAIRSLIQQFCDDRDNEHRRIHWYWYPTGTTAAEMECEIADLKEHYHAIWVLPDYWWFRGVEYVE